jgi:hypothetical protein
MIASVVVLLSPQEVRPRVSLETHRQQVWAPGRHGIRDNTHQSAAQIAQSVAIPAAAWQTETGARNGGHARAVTGWSTTLSYQCQVWMSRPIGTTNVRVGASGRS